MQLFELAGDSLSQAYCHKLAAQSYESAAAFDKAAEAFLLARLFPDAVRIIKTQPVAPKTASVVTKQARIEFCRNGEMKAAREVFDSTEDQIECTSRLPRSTLRFRSIIDALFSQTWRNTVSTLDPSRFDCRSETTSESHNSKWTREICSKRPTSSPREECSLERSSS